MLHCIGYHPYKGKIWICNYIYIYIIYIYVCFIERIRNKIKTKFTDKMIS